MIDCDARNLLVAAPYSWKDRCKSLPGARWDKAAHRWRCPLTPAGARAIQEAFNGAARWTDSAVALLRAADQIAEAGQHKTAATLPEIPRQKTAAWHHQKQAFWFARELPACLIAAEMGTGKSKIAVDLLVNRQVSATLILCPKSVVSVWPREFDRHAAVPVAVSSLDDGAIADRFRTLEQARALAAVRQQPFVAVLNYEAAWRMEGLLNLDWEAVVLDESHKIKAPGGKAALFCSRLGDRVPFRLCLTGTPLPHSPLDAYAQYRFLDKGIFGTSFVAFRSRYARMGGYGNHQVIGWQNQDELHQKMYSIAFRVQAKDVLDLPEVLDETRTCRLSTYAMGLYRELKTDFVAGLGDGTITASNALTRLLRLQQLTSGWAKPDRRINSEEASPPIQVDQAKQELLADLLDDLASTEPIVVFCRFHHDLDAVHTVTEALGRVSLELSGRRNDLAAWQTPDGPPILAVQIQSGGVGIDLTRAAYTVFYSLGFSLGEYLQARARTHRPGQTRTTRYFHLLAERTVDAQVYRALQDRQDVIESILATRKDW